MKLVALYAHPNDVDAFEAEYANHLKLVEKIPGLAQTRLTRFSRTLAGGDGFYLMAEMIFADKESFKAAMKSPEMAETGKDAQRFAADILTTMIAAEE
ncbi:MAG: EthD family reductase [Chloroflexota bacterium]